MHVHLQPRRVFKDRDGRVRHYKGLDEEVPEERPEGVCIHVWVGGRGSSVETGGRLNEVCMVWVWWACCGHCDEWEGRTLIWTVEPSYTLCMLLHVVGTMCTLLQSIQALVPLRLLTGHTTHGQTCSYLSETKAMHSGSTCEGDGMCPKCEREEIHTYT